MSDEFERLDRLLPQLVQALDVPGEDAAVDPESIWRRLDLLYQSMGADALTAMLRRQGLDGESIDDTLGVLGRRRIALS